MDAKTEDRLADAKNQARAQFESVREMVEELEAANAAACESGPTPNGDYDDRNESARQAIHEDALSVQVRSGWHTPGDKDGQKAAEFEILLCTGGPAVRIIGNLSEHQEPESAVLECQDWFQPWTPVPIGKTGEERARAEEILLTYCREFYFGD